MKNEFFPRSLFEFVFLRPAELKGPISKKLDEQRVSLQLARDELQKGIDKFQDSKWNGVRFIFIIWIGFIYNIIMDSTCQDYGLPISIPVYFSGGPSEKVDEEGEWRLGRVCKVFEHH